MDYILKGKTKIYFDDKKKHKNLVFIYKKHNNFYKIVVGIYDNISRIVTAGRVNIGNIEKEDDYIFIE